MFGGWLRKSRDQRQKPLAHSANRAPGTVRPEGAATAISVVVLEATGTGIIVQADRPYARCDLVIGQYAVGDVLFAYRGQVTHTVDNQDGTWDWHITFVMPGM